MLTFAGNRLEEEVAPGFGKELCNVTGAGLGETLPEC